ncbi:MAG: hypothetical protein DELT_00481 [Desulfovibrio sp.]
MNILSLDEVRESGFEFRNYSQYPPIGDVTVHLDFLVQFNLQTVFFRETRTGGRYYLALPLRAEPGVMTPYALTTFFSSVQRGDVCLFSIFQSKFGHYCLSRATLIEQLPICERREQCDQRSPCCVFKS